MLECRYRYFVLCRLERYCMYGTCTRYGSSNTDYSDVSTARFPSETVRVMCTRSICICARAYILYNQIFGNRGIYVPDFISDN